jgi:cysteinyl-tRNA synthetase
MKKNDVPLVVYNTMNRAKEAFVPMKKGRVGMYTCGPTVYWYATIGNMRTYIFSDIVRRVFEYNGLKVKQVMNVTDVGHLQGDGDAGVDKMEAAAAQEKRSAKEIADHYLAVFKEDMKKLNILSPQVWPRATAHIREQIALVKKLEKRGFTYKTSDGIYFNSARFPNYSRLARLHVEDLQEGSRVSMGDKKHKTDFALWKFSDIPGMRQQEWKAPWGMGYPGWHLECSAMAMKYLGERFDVHTGGEDHIPVHHTNEIAQSEAATGKKFVNYWMHGAFLMFNGEKVSKSKGGLYTVSELQEQGYHPLDYRYLCLMTHYRKPLDFSLEALEAAKNARTRLERKVIELRKEKVKGSAQRAEMYREQFHRAVNDDMNVPAGLAVMWNMMDDSSFDAKKKLALLLGFDNVLGLDVKNMKEKKVSMPALVKKLAAERVMARKMKDWTRSDALRREIEEKGFSVEDGPEGQNILKKS